MYLCEPERLLSQESSEVCGSQVLDVLFTGLVAYDPETSEVVEGGMASSIESDDNVDWTIEIEEGWEFHNGEEVTADNYVDAWNWMADPENEMGNASFLATAGFEGYQEVADGEADEMAGVEVVDDYTIEVSLVEPFGPFELLIGYTGFHPLPDEFYDMEATEFEEAPIGNGPYMMDGEWERGQRIMLERFDDYGGEPANAQAVEMRIYDDVGTAYLDFEAGELDIHDGVPPESRTQALEEYGDRAFDNEVSSYDYLGFPTFVEPFDDPDLRKAISLAIDRESIIDVIFEGARTPATSALPPILPAHRDGACDYCEHDPERAQELYEGTDGIDGTLELYFNSGAGHEEWMESVSLQLEDTLGIDDIEFNSLEFAEYLELHDAQEVEGPYRLGWVTVYPSPQYSMELYLEDSPSNYAGYDDPEFNDLMAEANATEPEEADEIYQEAEDILLEDLPIAPLWYGLDTVVHSERVDNVIANTRTFIEVADVEVVE
ncbi:ABC transporter substrate-binding protein [Egibacter rhizosphaerae]|uniref:ABC transporter substrate-binding protein n=2 Tax=Egibacter rhizosphaerae TaxID=1670831 RepID=A0A411YKM7_9ACTN|nr:ABC transporter substrate-binding protein [Egibacter rhizosphaerae]